MCWFNSCSIPTVPAATYSPITREDTAEYVLVNRCLYCLPAQRPRIPSILASKGSEYEGLYRCYCVSWATLESWSYLGACPGAVLRV